MYLDYVPLAIDPCKPTGKQGWFLPCRATGTWARERLDEFQFHQVATTSNASGRGDVLRLAQAEVRGLCGQADALQALFDLRDSPVLSRLAADAAPGKLLLEDLSFLWLARHQKPWERLDELLVQPDKPLDQPLWAVALSQFSVPYYTPELIPFCVLYPLINAHH